MISTDQIQHLLEGRGSVVGDDGQKIGKIDQVYLDDSSGEPEWVTVRTGVFSNTTAFVPLIHGDVADEQIRVPYTKDQVKDSPRIEDAEGHLSLQQEADLHRHYGLDPARRTPTGPGGPQHHDDLDGPHGRVADEGAGTGRDTSGPTTDEAMTRSEEQLHIGTQNVETGRARLRKFIVTEEVTRTVPTTREEARLEREPITDANRDAAMAGGELTEEEHEVTLHEERPVVQKETVPVERVRLDTDTVTEDQQVSEQVRKEQIEADTDADDRDAGRPGDGR